MNVFEYILMPESELRGRRWIPTDVNTLEGKLVSPLPYIIYRMLLNLEIVYLSARLSIQVMRRRFEKSENSA